MDQRLLRQVGRSICCIIVKRLWEMCLLATFLQTLHVSVPLYFLHKVILIYILITLLYILLDVDCTNITNPGTELLDTKNWLDLQRLEKLVSCSDSLDINKVDVDGNTTLYNAALRGNLKVAQVVLGHPNIQFNKQAIDGSTPLFVASKERNTEIVSLLLAASGILVNKGNAEGVSPLQVAAKNG